MQATENHRAISKDPRVRSLRRELAGWQKGAVGLLALSLTTNAALCVAFLHRETTNKREIATLQSKLTYAQTVQTQSVEALGGVVMERDAALQELAAAAIQSANEKKERQTMDEAYAALNDYQYVGECTVTYYCPCTTCCGQWADGKTATGLPLTPGICAVDPDVIPLGSTVLVDGQRFLAADTGVSGNHIDIAVTNHQDAVNHGVRTESVWVLENETETEKE